MGSGVLQQIGFPFRLKLAEIAFESGSRVDGLHVFDVTVPPPRFERTRLQIAFVHDVGGVNELMTSEMILEPRFVFAIVDAALERLLFKMGALMIE